MRRAIFFLAVSSTLCVGLSATGIAHAASVTAQWVIDENARAGTSAWKIPAGTPKGIVERLSRDIGKALGEPKVLSALGKAGLEPHAMTPAEFGRYLKREYDTWGKIIRDANIKAE